MLRKSLLGILFLLLAFVIAKADVPPPKGYANIDVNYIVETKEDLSEYRFFFDFYGALEEVEIKSNGKTTVPPLGGGARYRTGKFLAIPKKSLAGIGEKLTNEQEQELSESIRDKKIDGVIELGDHTFITTVTTKQTKNYPVQTYIIERKDNSLKMFVKKKVSTKKKVASIDSDEEENTTQDNKHTAIAGVFLSLSFLFAGIFAFRKVR